MHAYYTVQFFLRVLKIQEWFECLRVYRSFRINALHIQYHFRSLSLSVSSLSLSYSPPPLPFCIFTFCLSLSLSLSLFSLSYSMTTSLLRLFWRKCHFPSLCGKLCRGFYVTLKTVWNWMFVLIRSFFAHKKLHAHSTHWQEVCGGNYAFLLVIMIKSLSLIVIVMGIFGSGCLAYP